MADKEPERFHLQVLMREGAAKSPDALAHIARTVCKQHADVIYGCRPIAWTAEDQDDEKNWVRELPLITEENQDPRYGPVTRAKRF